MKVRFVIMLVVAIILFVASYYKGWWTKKYLNKFLAFLGFDYYVNQPDPETRHYYLVGAEQWVHFSIGIFVGITFNPILPTWLTAFLFGLIKEILDAVFKGSWHKKDSIMDLAFHTLGGFCAPFMMMVFNIFV